MPTRLVHSSNVVETAAANRLMILTGHAPATIPLSTVPGQVAVPFPARANASEGNDNLMLSVGSKPSVVVYPTSKDDVVKIVKTAIKYRTPVIPYSGATSLEGHFRAVRLFLIVRAFCDLPYLHSRQSAGSA